MEPQTWNDYFAGLLPLVFIILLWLVPVLIAFARLRKHTLDDAASHRAAPLSLDDKACESTVNISDNKLRKYHVH